ncbi:MAG TPA: BrxA/BrxB family bacilliredoxin [Thermoanaerobaculia bacterium]|jgi:putative YphP/YqiW family bacilliredoxin|nr:BrxA/BrxB family bacilliredoxin [Thermoanaerobaculia bacterium]
MPYDPTLIQPFRDELTRLGFQELRTKAEVDAALPREAGSTLLVVNSVCGCAAGQARPGVAKALQNAKKPDHLTTVFAGQDLEATAHARSYLTGYRPSSPSIALFRDGKLVFMLERFQIEQKNAAEVAGQLTAAFETYCG